MLMESLCANELGLAAQVLPNLETRSCSFVLPGLSNSPRRRCTNSMAADPRLDW